jgi:hypothetical protein
MKIILRAKNIQYLAKLVDEDTTGDQQDTLYQVLMVIYNHVDDEKSASIDIVPDFFLEADEFSSHLHENKK